jgi:hypothetical protein
MRVWAGILVRSSISLSSSPPFFPFASEVFTQGELLFRHSPPPAYPQ